MATYATVLSTLSFLIATATVARLWWTERIRVVVFTRVSSRMTHATPPTHRYEIFVTNLSRRDIAVTDVGLREPGEHEADLPISTLVDFVGDGDVELRGPSIPCTVPALGQEHWRVDMRASPEPYDGVGSLRHISPPTPYSGYAEVVHTRRLGTRVELRRHLGSTNLAALRETSQYGSPDRHQKNRRMTRSCTRVWPRKFVVFRLLLLP